MIHPIFELEPVLTVEEITEAQAIVKHVHVSAPVERYIVEMVRKTREHPEVYLGASPRGSLGLYRAGQARAALMGRDFVLPDDIKHLAPYILAHRVVVSPSARITDVQSTKLLPTLFTPWPFLEEI